MLVQTKTIKKVTESGSKRHIDNVVIEKTSHIYLNDVLIATLSHTSQNEKELGVGYLFSLNRIGFVIESVTYEDGLIRIKASEEVTSAIHHQSTIKPNAGDIFQLTAYFQEAALLYKKTAVTESAALGKGNTLLYSAEDMTQMNAFYKVIGAFLINKNHAMTGYSLLVSACITAEMMAIIIRCGVSLVITRTAPTHQALNMAGEHGVSIVGFARGRKYNWYY